MKNRFLAIPKSFNVAKYDGAEQFGITEWATNLIDRNSDLREARLFFGAEPLILDDGERASIRFSLLRRCLRRLQVPLLRAGARDLNIYRHEPRAEPVKDLTMGDLAKLMHHKDRLLETQPTFARLFMPGVVTDRLEVADEELRALADTPCGHLVDRTGNYETNYGIATVTLDLHAPVQETMKSMERYLGRRQEELEVPDQQKRFDRKSFARWHRTRVLAYVDLCIFAILTRTKITDYALGVALFPDEIELANPAERVRRTVRPVAERAMTAQAATLLAAQAHEATARPNV